MNISVFTVKHQWARHGKGTPKAVKKEKRKGKGWKIIQEEKDIAHVNCTTSLISCISWFWDLHIFDTDLNILTSHLLKNYDCGLHFYKILHGILSWNLQKDKEILYNKTIWMFITIMYSTIWEVFRLDQWQWMVHWHKTVHMQSAHLFQLVFYY